MREYIGITHQFRDLYLLLAFTYEIKRSKSIITDQESIETLIGLTLIYRKNDLNVFYLPESALWPHMLSDEHWLLAADIFLIADNFEAAHLTWRANVAPEKYACTVDDQIG